LEQGGYKPDLFGFVLGTVGRSKNATRTWLRACEINMCRAKYLQAKRRCTGGARFGRNPRRLDPAKIFRLAEQRSAWKAAVRNPRSRARAVAPPVSV